METNISGKFRAIPLGGLIAHLITRQSLRMDRQTETVSLKIPGVISRKKLIVCRASTRAHQLIRELIPLFHNALTSCNDFLYDQTLIVFQLIQHASILMTSQLMTSYLYFDVS